MEFHGNLEWVFDRRKKRKKGMLCTNYHVFLVDTIFTCPYLVRIRLICVQNQVLKEYLSNMILVKQMYQLISMCLKPAQILILSSACAAPLSMNLVQLMRFSLMEHFFHLNLKRDFLLPKKSVAVVDIPWCVQRRWPGFKSPLSQLLNYYNKKKRNP